MTTTRTRSTTVTIAGGDVRQVIRLASEEIRAICRATADLTRDFAIDETEIDLALFCLNDVISEIVLQIYHGDELGTQEREIERARARALAAANARAAGGASTGALITDTRELEGVARPTPEVRDPGQQKPGARPGARRPGRPTGPGRPRSPGGRP